MKRRHHCKSSHAKVTLAVLALCGMTAFWGSAAWAADAGQTPNLVQDGIHYFSVNPEDGNRDNNYDNDGAVGTDSLAVGAGAHADGSMGATALGNDAVANGERALAVGNGSKATGLDAIAIGTGSDGESNGTNAIAIGNQSHAKGMYTTTVGGFSEATAQGAVALGQQAKSKGVYSTSIGMMANGMGYGGTAAKQSTAVGAYSESSGVASVALGYKSRAAGLNGTAVGSKSVASATGSVALGYNSQATEQDILQSDGSDGVVSVGKSAGQPGEKGMTRRIINVKDGVKATDAANVSQLTELREGDHITITDSETPNEKGQTVKTISAKVDGQIGEGNTGILSGNTVYNEVHVDKDGNYIKSDYTVSENLNALDGQVKTNADNLSALDNQITANTESIYRINNRVSNLDNKINKVGAGAAALAALHPLDFDPDDKWDFAVGYGNYRNASSVAFGAFYRPNEDTMFSLGTNLGNGENMINAGLSFKIGPKGKSKNRQGLMQEITELRATVASQDSEIKELKIMVQQLMAKQDK